MNIQLADIFADHLTEAQRVRHGNPDLPARLQVIVEHAAAAWPTVSLDPTAFVTHLAEVLSRPENRTSSLEELLTDDLYLACACATGNARALAVCEAHAAPEIDGSLRRMDQPQAMIDEVKQILRERLFVSADGRPYIAAYSGRGRLSGWMRVIAVRYALQALRRQKRVRPLEDADLAHLAEAPQHHGASPEHQHMKMLYQEEFQSALRRAVDTLPPRERDLLQAHFIRGETIDQLGETYGVHRATAARWLDRAKRALIAAIRRTMMRELHVDRDTYQSVLRLVRSQLDLSVRIILGQANDHDEQSE